MMLRLPLRQLPRLAFFFPPPFFGPPVLDMVMESYAQLLLHLQDFDIGAKHLRFLLEMLERLRVLECLQSIFVARSALQFWLPIHRHYHPETLVQKKLIIIVQSRKECAVSYEFLARLHYNKNVYKKKCPLKKNAAPN